MANPASAALVALLLASVACSGPAREPLEALELDDLCAADPASEECSASFRQLRGLQVRNVIEEAPQKNDTGNVTEPPPAEADEAAGEGDEDAGDEDPAETTGEEEEEEKEEPTESAEDEEPGVCCFSGENPADTCGTCYPTAIATDARCSRKSQCGGCGGTWCRSVCAMGAADPNDKCGTAFETGLAAPGSYCAKGPETCASCSGEWCMRGVKKSKEEDAGEAQTKALGAVAGFCCYRAEEEDACGACADVATDVFCSTKGHCGTCGGTWCEGPKCVIGAAEEDNPCGSVWPEGGLAGPDSFCSHSEEACAKCSGAWCRDSAIKYVGSSQKGDAKDDADAADDPVAPPPGVGPPVQDPADMDDSALPNGDEEEEWDLPEGEGADDADEWELGA